MLFVDLLLKTAVFPVLTCASCFWGLLKIGSRWPNRVSTAAGVAFGAGYLIGHTGIRGRPPLFPLETTQWLFYVVLVSVFVAVWQARAGRSRLLPAGLVLAALLATTLKPMVTYHWESGQAVLWSGALFGGLLLLRHILDLVDFERPSSLLPLAFFWTMLASSAVLALSATALLAQLAATAALCLAVLTAYSLRAPLPVVGWLPVAFTVLTGLLLNGHFYARLGGVEAALLLLAPVGASISGAPWMKRHPPGRRLVLALSAVFLITAPALIGAGRSYLGEPAYDYDYDDYVYEPLEE